MIIQVAVMMVNEITCILYVYICKYLCIHKKYLYIYIHTPLLPIGIPNLLSIHQASCKIQNTQTSTLIIFIPSPKKTSQMTSPAFKKTPSKGIIFQNPLIQKIHHTPSNLCIREVRTNTGGSASPALLNFWSAYLLGGFNQPMNERCAQLSNWIPFPPSLGVKMFLKNEVSPPSYTLCRALPFQDAAS